MKLYELTAKWTQLRDILDGLTDPDEIESFRETLDATEGDIREKAEYIAVLIKELGAESDALRNEEKALAARRKTCENRAESLERYLMGQMTAFGVEKVVGACASVTIAKTPAKVVIHDIEALKEMFEYWKPYKFDEANVDKTSLKADLAQGTVVDPRIATLETGTTLRIK